MREPVKLNFTPDSSDFAPKSKAAAPKPGPERSPQVDSRTKADAAEAASRAEGFTSRSGKAAKKVDGRSLRRTGRTQQMNINVTPETKARFLSLVHEGGFRAGGEFLDHLLDLYESKKA